MLALGSRLWAVDALPPDYDEDDYLRAGQQYATGIQTGDWGVFLRENYRPEHPQLNKILYGFVLAPLPAVDEIPDRAPRRSPRRTCPSRTSRSPGSSGAVFGALGSFALALLNPFAGLFLAFQTGRSSTNRR